MQRIGLTVVGALVALCALAPSAFGAFGISDFSAKVLDQNGHVVTQAGATPYVGITDFTLTSDAIFDPVKDIRVDLPPGLISNPQATPTKCASLGSCDHSTQVGTIDLTVASLLPLTNIPVYNMVPAPGEVSDFAFDGAVLGLGTTHIIGGVDAKRGYGLFFTIHNALGLPITHSKLTFFGDPHAHGTGAPPASFIRLPTACAGPQVTTLTVVSASGVKATKADTTKDDGGRPIGATGCDALPYAPQMTVTTRAARRGDPAALTVELQQGAGEANSKSVSVKLPPQLAARLPTIAQACPLATFQTGPAACNANSKVGTVSASTPLLAQPLTGTAYLEAHSGGVLPTLEAVLQGPGITVDLSGTFNLGNGLQSTFPSIPDLPLTTFRITLPAYSANSALSATADLCAGPLPYTATLVGQSGKSVAVSGQAGVAGCGIAIAKSSIRRHVATLSVHLPGPGTLAIAGKGMTTVRRTVTGAGTYSLRTKLTKRGLKSLQRALHHKRKRQRKLTVKLRVAYTPASGASAAGELLTPSAATRKVVFKK